MCRVDRTAADFIFCQITAPPFQFHERSRKVSKTAIVSCCGVGMAAFATPHAADNSTDDEDEDIATERKRISPYRRVVSEAAEKRFIVCSAVVDQDMTINRACTNAGVPSRTYYDLDWVGEYRRGGFEAT